MVQQKILTSRGYLTRINNQAEIPEGAQAGAITTTVLTASTPTTIAEGTAVSNATNTTQATLTFVDEQVTFSLKPSAAKSWYTKPENIEKIAFNHADALLFGAIKNLVVDYVAATPGDTQTLTVGQIDFGTDGTDAEARDNLTKMMQAVAYLMGNAQNTSPEDYAIVMPLTAFAKFIALRSPQTPFAIYNNQTFNYEFNGIPIFPIAYTTNFGGASKECAFITHRDAAACAFIEPFVQNGGPMYHYDGMWKWVTCGPYAHGVVNATLLAAIANPAS